VVPLLDQPIRLHAAEALAPGVEVVDIVPGERLPEPDEWTEAFVGTLNLPVKGKATVWSPGSEQAHPKLLACLDDG
jgi:hypothetical protein